ncbi:hypothetical protein XapA_20615 [Xanthomonas citri pv. punicae]|nr:hypothetical protein CAI17_16300 [Xanthomonas citri pv. punicae]QCZ78822.1 hypothetical protein XapA_20615 [Xanthomonas citri pv. punicae]QCZ88180.1 hypothetical protein DOO79_01830 [Xanthomonas citri pv. punicae]
MTRTLQQTAWMAVQCRQPFAVQLQMDFAVRRIAVACGMTQKGERCRPSLPLARIKSGSRLRNSALPHD